MAESKKEYKWVGNHPQEFPGGRTLAVGETIELSDDEVRHPLVEDMLANETLIGTDKKSEHEAELASRRTSGRKEGGGT